MPEQTEHGLLPAGRGWFVLNARDARWFDRKGQGYEPDDAALRHAAGVEKETNDAAVAYARFPEPEPTRYRDGWLPSD